MIFFPHADRRCMPLWVDKTITIANRRHGDTAGTHSATVSSSIIYDLFIHVLSVSSGVFLWVLPRCVPTFPKNMSVGELAVLNCPKVWNTIYVCVWCPVMPYHPIQNVCKLQTRKDSTAHNALNPYWLAILSQNTGCEVQADRECPFVCLKSSRISDIKC